MPKRPSAPQAWLIVERKENWAQDEKGGFQVLGFPERYLKIVSRFQQGDELFIYVASGISSIAGSRAVVSEKPYRSNDLVWDEIFPVRIRTRPLVSLLRDRWINIHGLAGEISFLKDKTDWRQCFRQAIRQLEPADALAIRKALKETSPTTGKD